MDATHTEQPAAVPPTPPTPPDSLRPDAAPEEQSLEETMRAVSERLPPEGVTLHDIIGLIGKDSLLLLCIFLTLIFMIPVSIPGVSTVFGAAILMIGISRLFNRNLWLPQRVMKRVIPTQKLRGTFDRALKWLRRLERISRPHRMRWLTVGGPVAVVNNLSLILGAVLLMAPFGLIPFSNTLPALAILLLALGLLQRDGVCILLGHLANVGTICYFAFLIGGGGVAIKQAIERIF